MAGSLGVHHFTYGHVLIVEKHEHRTCFRLVVLYILLPTHSIKDL